MALNSLLCADVPSAVKNLHTHSLHGHPGIGHPEFKILAPSLVTFDLDLE